MKRILVIGCGLLGTSLALALAGRKTKYVLYGAEANSEFAENALKSGAFRQVYNARAIPETHFDIVILAVPVRAACTYLEQAFAIGSIVVDICSVKSSICEAAQAAPDRNRFVPTHPMAGKAMEGPVGADENLFSGNPWLYIRGWPAIEQVLPLMMDTGAIPIGIDTPELHDQAMAIVSHGIHLISLSAMIAYGRTVEDTEVPLASLSGPAFRDITRLAASPSGFWVETLLENQKEVLAHLDKVTDAIANFKEALHLQDADRLTKLLDEARNDHQAWRGDRDLWHLR